jgi:uncharacterized Ntn-hydrolase superfamily protein
VPWAKAGVGAVATQAAGVAAFGSVPSLLEEGLEPGAAPERALADDPGRESRQLGVVTADGRAAAHTGSECLAWAGHRVGDGYAVQGNILAGEAVVGEMERAFLETTGASLADRLVSALEAAQAAGGDARGQESSALVVERTGAAAEWREGIDRVCELRVEDHPEPIVELRRLLGIHRVWDALRRASSFHETGEYAEGAVLLRAALGHHGDDAVLLYDPACFDSLAGDTEEALAHLSRSLELDPKLRPGAARDSDFEPLRQDPRFQALVS